MSKSEYHLYCIEVNLLLKLMLNDKNENDPNQQIMIEMFIFD